MCCHMRYHLSPSGHQLGVNGYFFMVTNNGHVMFHRDFRPVVR